jgi:glycosyltransferase involved in cell wall biosynthesis
VTRVLILNERDPRHPKAGGAEVHVAEIFRRLVPRGFEVEQLVSSFAGGAERETIDGMQVRRVGALPFYYLRAAAVCARESRRGKADVVVECLNKLPFLSPLYTRVPVLALCHHLFGEAAFRQVSWPVAATVWSVERLIPRIYRRERFVAISESTRDDLVRRGIAPERVEVQHPGIRQPELAPPGIAERKHQLVYLGRLEPYKNVDLLIRALTGLAERFPEVSLVVIGEGSERERLERLAEELCVAQRTRFTGFVSEAEKDRLLAGSRVCVCPSAKEGWGLTVIESNALGTPNVASDSPGLRDSVRHGETGFLVPEGDVAAIEERVGALLGDDALAARMSLAALAWSRRFQWDRAADQMAKALESARGPG